MTMRLTIDGITLNRRQWAERIGVDPATISRRLQSGVSILMARQGAATLYPEREWLTRNLAMLRRARNKEAYLRGVELARGESFARQLREAL